MLPHQGGIRTEYGAIGQAEAAGAVKNHPPALLIGPEQKTHHQSAVASTCFAAGWGHLNQVTAGIKLQHGVGIGLAESRKLLGGELQILREPQRCQGISRRSWRCKRRGQEVSPT